MDISSSTTETIPNLGPTISPLPFSQVPSTTTESVVPTTTSTTSSTTPTLLVLPPTPVPPAETPIAVLELKEDSKDSGDCIHPLHSVACAAANNRPGYSKTKKPLELVVWPARSEIVLPSLQQYVHLHLIS